MRRLATLAAVGAAGIVAAGCGSAGHVSAAAHGTPVTVAGLDLTVPTGLHFRRFSTCNSNVTGIPGACVHGIHVASYPLKAASKMGGGGRFSANRVSLELYRRPAGQPGIGDRLGERSLSTWAFHPVTHTMPIMTTMRPPPPEQYEALFRSRGASYWAVAWVGTGATHAERRALAALIASVHASGVSPRSALPPPPRQVLHMLCSGSPAGPRMPSDTLEGDYGRICAQVSGTKCRVWTQKVGAPASAIRERHFKLARFFCGRTRRFLAEYPRGWTVEPRPAHLVLH